MCYWVDTVRGETALINTIGPMEETKEYQYLSGVLYADNMLHDKKKG